MSDTFQWQRCEPDGTGCADLVGETAATYLQTGSDVGKRLRVTGSRDGGLTTVTSSLTAIVSALTDTSDYDTATAYSASRPAFTPSRTVNVASQAQLAAAITDLQSGDLVQATADFSVSGEFEIAKQPAAVAEIHLDNAGHVVTFTGAAAHSQLPNVWLHGTKNVRIYGGLISGGGGDGILCYDLNNVLWWDFKVQNAAAQGVHFAGITRQLTGADFKGEVTNCGLDLTQDPHAEAGTGLHGVYLGGSAYTIINSRFAFWVHNQPTGAGVQINKCNGCTFYVKADDLTKVATSQVAGNAIQWWGVNGQVAAVNCTVPYLEGNNLTGRMSEIGAGVEPTATFTGNTVTHGRGINVMTNGLLTGSPYRAHTGIVYTDCT